MAVAITGRGGVEAGLGEIERTAKWIWPASNFEEKTPQASTLSKTPSAILLGSEWSITSNSIPYEAHL